MTPNLENFTLALAGEPRCLMNDKLPWYMTVLEAIRTDAIEAITTFPEMKLESLEMVFWRHTTNCLRSGSNKGTYIFTLNSNPTFEVYLSLDKDLRLLSARADSEALSEADPILIDVTKYVAVFYQEFLIHLVQKLERLRQDQRKI